MLAYRAKLMTMTRHPDALEYVRSARQLIVDSPTPLDFRDYCGSYCAYLECVLLGGQTEEAKQSVLSKPSTAFIRNSLLVI